jgi:hypothetical protein
MMWQLQWAVSLIPDAMLNWIYWAIIAIGLTGVLAGWVGKFIPFYGNYVKILQPIGIILLVLGVWLRGGYDVEMSWRAKVADVEAKIAIAEQKSQETNTVIEQKVVEKTKVIKGKTEYITQYLDREVIKKEEIIKYIEQCPVPKEIIDVHNQAAEMNKAAEGFKK